MAHRSARRCSMWWDWRWLRVSQDCGTGVARTVRRDRKRHHVFRIGAGADCGVAKQRYGAVASAMRRSSSKKLKMKTTLSWLSSARPSVATAAATRSPSG